MNREDLPAGPLRHGNPHGDPNTAPGCGARNRAGGACRAPAMANGRCRSHGGTSTGPRTEAGLAARRANAIVLLNDGWSCAAVAAAQLIDDDSVRSWHKLYAEHGLVAPHSISISSPYP